MVMLHRRPHFSRDSRGDGRPFKKGRAMPEKFDFETDYVVVGAGSAGCVLANRLSVSAANRVVLLEAGGDDRPLKQLDQFFSNVMIHIPSGFSKAWDDPRVNWMYKTAPDHHTGERVHNWHKGKVLGGSSSINGLLYMRGQVEDYDGWRQMGCTGWSFDDVLPYFRRAQHQERGESEFHGTGGPLNVADYPDRSVVNQALIDACVEAGIPLSEDINGRDQEGVTWLQATTLAGRRCSAAVAYLRPAEKRSNLRIETRALARRILFEGKRAIGVEFSRNGKLSRVRARAEVILAAGSIESPKLLELSGVGRGDILRDHGIDVLHEAPGVGENMQDHFLIGCQWRVKSEYLTLNQRSHGLNLVKEVASYVLKRKGLLSCPVAGAIAFARTREELATPDAMINLLAASLDFSVPGTFKLERLPGATCASAQLRPESRGSVHIGSNDPDVHPVIKANYLSDRLDQQCAIDQLRLIRRIVNQPALAPFLESTACHFGETEESMLGYARMAGQTLYHPVGTCRMGEDPAAVLDPQLRVRGVDGLRVCDCSIMPRIVSAGTNAAAIMIGERAADFILDREASLAIVS